MRYSAGMKRVLSGIGLLLMALLPAAVSAQQADDPFKRRVQASLIAEVETVAPGKPFWVAMRQVIDPGWHTYWRNPGDSGQPTELQWDLPPGFQASAIHWPLPEAIPTGPLVNYGYSNEVLLPVRISPPQTLPDGPLRLAADARWLVCEEICIPEEGRIELTLMPSPAGEAARPSFSLGDIAAARRQVPVPGEWQAEARIEGDLIALTVVAPDLDRAALSDLYFFPDDWGLIDHAAAQTVTWTDQGPVLTLQRGDLRDEPVTALSGVLAMTEALGAQGVRQGFTLAAGKVVDLSPAATGAATTAGSGGGAAHADDVAASPSGGIGLFQALLFAVLGGLILNLMPCVFPVLSLKALAIARHGQGEAAVRRAHGGAYFAGVLASFGVLGGLLLGLRATGALLGWGFQFQTPGFVLAMAALFFALGLSLSGVFSLGATITGLGTGLAERRGLAGSFFTGVLASIAATPCTAPFMGAAIGFALGQPPLTAFLILQALAVGFALPLTLVSFSTTLARLLPRPGAWMDTLKQVLAFPLYASAGWMVWVLSEQVGSDGVLAAAVALTAIGFAAWLYGRSEGRWQGALVALAIAVLALVGAWPLTESDPHRPSRQAAALEDGSEAFTAERLRALRADGQAVFVNFTAAWCITCKVNEKVALASPEFVTALRTYNVAYLKGDWTQRDPEIAGILKRYGRAGVPLYLLYPAGDPDGPPEVLPQLLTEAMIVERLAASSPTRISGPVSEKESAS